MPGGILDEARKRLPTGYSTYLNAPTRPSYHPAQPTDGVEVNSSEEDCVTMGGTWDPVRQVCMINTDSSGNQAIVAPEPTFEEKQNILATDPLNANYNDHFQDVYNQQAADALINPFGQSTGVPLDPSMIDDSWTPQASIDAEEQRKKQEEQILKFVSQAFPLFGSIVDLAKAVDKRFGAGASNSTAFNSVVNDPANTRGSGRSSGVSAAQRAHAANVSRNEAAAQARGDFVNTNASGGISSNERARLESEGRWAQGGRNKGGMIDYANQGVNVGNPATHPGSP